jgi:adhesin/invasin
MDSAGFVYISDSFNARIRKLLQNGAIVTVAGDGCCGYSGDGGAATSAQLYFPHGLVVDGKGNIYVCDTANSVIRLLTPVYPAISAGGVANAASGSARLSPGSLATVYGNYFTSSTASAPAPLPTSLGGVSVTVNGVPSPILFANSTQINFQVPSSTQTGTANVAVSQSGGAGNTIAVPVVAAAPGLFLNANGTAVVQNYPSYSLNTPSNPIPAGGTIVAYLTGIGPVLPSVPDGAATPVSPNSNAALPCSATIGGTTAIVSFIGLTPGYVGLAQANIMVPSGLTSGSNPLVVTCNGQASNSAAIGVQ